MLERMALDRRLAAEEALARNRLEAAQRLVWRPVPPPCPPCRPLRPCRVGGRVVEGRGVEGVGAHARGVRLRRRGGFGCESSPPPPPPPLPRLAAAWCNAALRDPPNLTPIPPRPAPPRPAPPRPPAQSSHSPPPPARPTARHAHEGAPAAAKSGPLCAPLQARRRRSHAAASLTAPNRTKDGQGRCCKPLLSLSSQSTYPKLHRLGLSGVGTSWVWDQSPSLHTQVEAHARVPLGYRNPIETRLSTQPPTSILLCVLCG